MASFYLDEDVPYAVTAMLAQYGHDAVHTVDLGNQGLPDPGQLWLAANTGRILVTFNRRDFRLVHHFWVALNTWGVLSDDHAGILTSLGQTRAAPWADLVHEFVSQGRGPWNQMWEWHPREQNWYPYGW